MNFFHTEDTRKVYPGLNTQTFLVYYKHFLSRKRKGGVIALFAGSIDLWRGFTQSKDLWWKHQWEISTTSEGCKEATSVMLIRDRILLLSVVNNLKDIPKSNQCVKEFQTRQPNDWLVHGIL